MKRIFLKAIPYFVGFIILNLVCYSTSNFYKQERKYQNRIELASNSQNEIIFLGDSHSETVKLLDTPNNIGNLAFGADGIKEMYIKSLVMEKFNPKLKYVFICTEPQMFNNSLSSNSTFLSKYLLDVEDTLDVYAKNYLDIITERAPLFNDNYLKFFLNNIYTKLKPKTPKKDVVWHELPEEERISIATNTGKLDHGSVLASKQDIEIFKTLINLYRSNNYTIIGIRFPVSEHYISQCNEEDLAKVNALIKSLDLDYHLDYSTQITNPVYFADEDHLNKEGIEKLVKMIYNDTQINLME